MNNLLYHLHSDEVAQLKWRQAEVFRPVGVDAVARLARLKEDVREEPHCSGRPSRNADAILAATLMT